MEIIAQLVERLTVDQEVVGSSPTGLPSIAGLAGRRLLAI